MSNLQIDKNRLEKYLFTTSEVAKILGTTRGKVRSAISLGDLVPDGKISYQSGTGYAVVFTKDHIIEYASRNNIEPNFEKTEYTIGDIAQIAGTTYTKIYRDVLKGILVPDKKRKGRSRTKYNLIFTKETAMEYIMSEWAGGNDLISNYEIFGNPPVNIDAIPIKFIENKIKELQDLIENENDEQQIIAYSKKSANLYQLIEEWMENYEHIN